MAPLAGRARKLLAASQEQDGISELPWHVTVAIVNFLQTVLIGKLHLLFPVLAGGPRAANLDTESDYAAVLVACSMIDSYTDHLNSTYHHDSGGPAYSGRYRESLSSLPHVFYISESGKAELR